ncbi:hypothetical protein [Paraburkholderia fungorum]|uniref:hypothetical protein n=1 Tax=Paraburkholderia fungorum TaxID=134537 RepID=UPI00161B9E44|nr:hypothetical protein [Paraburkholderia fungorum]MBB5546580.1 hypothetical protein [Paraburkholderia fungorum]
MVFDTMCAEVRELVELLRKATEWAIMGACGKVSLGDVSTDARVDHQARTTRVAELQTKYR